MQDEIDLIVTMITHSAGYDVGLFGALTVRPVDQGVYCVSSEHWEKQFIDPRQAAEYFVKKRNRMKLGSDHEIGAMFFDDGVVD